MKNHCFPLNSLNYQVLYLLNYVFDIINPNIQTFIFYFYYTIINTSITSYRLTHSGKTESLKNHLSRQKTLKICFFPIHFHCCLFINYY